MNEIFQIILYSFSAGITVFLGGLLSWAFECFKNRSFYELVTHSLVAFGGGVLISAVTFVLIPKGMAVLNILPLSIAFLSGTVFFCLLDRKIEKKGGAFAQLMAMLMDFVPEAIALGAVFAYHIRLGLLLALFIGLQNLPESFNAYIELKNHNHSTKKSLILLFLLSFVGIISALLGDFFLADKPVLIAGLMVFSGGGIVFLMFQDIAPLSKLKNSWPAISASIGFCVGMIGTKVLGPGN
jgi:ZIP family zinc transporter